LPRPASQWLRAVDQGAFGTLAEASAALSRLTAVPDRISATTRGMALALSVVGFASASAGLGGLLTHLTRLVPIGLPAFAPAELGVIGGAALSLIWAFTLRSGFWLRAFGIAVVTPDGVEVSRRRAVGRAALAWSWAPCHLLATTYGGPVVALALLSIAGVFYAAARPERGLHDHLAGTYLVPK
jgi:hypothetical protein